MGSVQHDYSTAGARCQSATNADAVEDGIYHIGTILDEIEAVQARSTRIERENVELQGRLREIRRENRALRRDCDRAVARAHDNAAYWRQFIVAAVGMAVALTCLLHSLILAGGGI